MVPESGVCMRGGKTEKERETRRDGGRDRAAGIDLEHAHKLCDANPILQVQLKYPEPMVPTAATNTTSGDSN